MIYCIWADSQLLRNVKIVWLPRPFPFLLDNMMDGPRQILLLEQRKICPDFFFFFLVSFQVSPEVLGL